MVEALSGVFDFNHAPFFQSFMEVRDERSKRRVLLILKGVDGPLRWRDLQASLSATGHQRMVARAGGAAKFSFPFIPTCCSRPAGSSSPTTATIA
jgi:hypothetical protein